MRPVVFLDRDDTIIVDRGYLSDPAGVELLPGAAGALERLERAGYALVVISNQSAIGRGYCTAAGVEAVNRRVEEVLADHGVALAAIYYCPHAPGEGCGCRKPEPGLILQAARELGADLARSIMVGDKPGDAEAGKRAGCGRNIVLSAAPVAGHETARDLAEAAERILGTPGGN